MKQGARQQKAKERVKQWVNEIKEEQDIFSSTVL